MFKVIIAFVFLLSIPTFSKGDEHCQHKTTETPPFYISDEFLQSKNKQWENLRDIDNDSKKKYYIPRGSIVYYSPDLFGIEANSSQRVPVKVLATPKNNIEKTLKQSRYYAPKKGWQGKRSFRDMVAGHKGMERAEEGHVGFMDERALRQISKYTFFVNEDAPSFKTPSGVDINASKIKSKMVDGKYQIKHCCEENPDPTVDTMMCYDHYLFDVFDEEDNQVLTLSGSSDGCELFKHVAPIPTQQASEIQSILELTEEAARFENLFVDSGVENIELIYAKNRWRGSQLRNDPKIAYVKIPIDEETGQGPFNSYHYNKDDEKNSDTFLKTHSACTFMQVMKKWNNDCKVAGCQLQFGDLYHEDSWLAHSSHDSGECVDIRPFRKNDDIQNSGLTYNYARYSRDKTEDFIKLLVKAGATPIYFNDEKILSKYKSSKYRSEINPKYEKTMNYSRKPRPVSGHANHLHFCFPKESADAKKACEKGIN